MHRVSIFGCGYTGSRVAARWLLRQNSVRGFANRTESLERIAATGAEPQQWNLDEHTAARFDVDGHLIYYMVPPPATGQRDRRLERLLERLSGTPRRFVYISTTGVYGDRVGAMVDEETPPQPHSERAIRRLAAESCLRAWADAREVSWCILRVPGIYGPGRLPLERLRRGQAAIDWQEATPTNRIHVEDLASACVAAGWVQNAHRRIYNITDGSDESLTAYLHRVARLAGLPPPPLISRALAKSTVTATSWSFLNESRRVDNGRMLKELGITLEFRDLDDGIRASL